MKPLLYVVGAMLFIAPLLAAEPFEGTWKLLPEQSQLGTTPDDLASVTMTISKIGAQEFRSAVDSTLRSGKSVHYEIDRTYDGKEHAAKGKGIPTQGRSLIAERVDSHTRKIINKKDGTVVSEMLSTVSTDGKTMKNVERKADGTEYIEILEKQ